MHPARAALNAAETEARALRTSLNAAETELNRLRTELNTARQEWTTTGADLNATQVELNTVRTALGLKEAALCDARAERETLKQQVESLSIPVQEAIQYLVSQARGGDDTQEAAAQRASERLGKPVSRSVIGRIVRVLRMAEA